MLCSFWAELLLGKMNSALQWLQCLPAPAHWVLCTAYQKFPYLAGLMLTGWEVEAAPCDWPFPQCLASLHLKAQRTWSAARCFLLSYGGKLENPVSSWTRYGGGDGEGAPSTRCSWDSVQPFGLGSPPRYGLAQHTSSCQEVKHCSGKQSCLHAVSLFC